MTATQHVQSHASGHTNPKAAVQPAHDAAAESPLARALEQNEAAADSVQTSADELLVINAVLKQEIPEDTQTGELAQALQKTDALEVRIHDTAEELAHVNEALAQEITERAELEDELAAAKAALAKADPTA
jgi:C4-dicarboxylate-specific signal transduction histidine kinase